jgi:hypothetical protein
MEFFFLIVGFLVWLFVVDTSDCRQWAKEGRNLSPKTSPSLVKPVSHR